MRCSASQMSCNEDSELEHGLAVLGVGAVLLGLGIYLQLTARPDAP